MAEKYYRRIGTTSIELGAGGDTEMREYTSLDIVDDFEIEVYRGNDVFMKEYRDGSIFVNLARRSERDMGFFRKVLAKARYLSTFSLSGDTVRFTPIPAESLSPELIDQIDRYPLEAHYEPELGETTVQLKARYDETRRPSEAA